MVTSECKKCHKPLENNDICDACKQKEIDKWKKYAKYGASFLSLLVTTVAVVYNAVKSDSE